VRLLQVSQHGRKRGFRLAVCKLAARWLCETVVAVIASRKQGCVPRGWGCRLKAKKGFVVICFSIQAVECAGVVHDQQRTDLQ
jgi:hypothetical protein